MQSAFFRIFLSLIFISIPVSAGWAGECINPGVIVSEQQFDIEPGSVASINVLNMSAASVVLTTADGRETAILTINENLVAGGQRTYQKLKVNNLRGLVQAVAAPANTDSIAGIIRTSWNVSPASSIHIHDFERGWVFWSYDSEYRPADGHFIHIVRQGDPRILRVVMAADSTEAQITDFLNRICG